MPRHFIILLLPKLRQRLGKARTLAHLAGSLSGLGQLLSWNLLTLLHTEALAERTRLLDGFGNIQLAALGHALRHFRLHHLTHATATTHVRPSDPWSDRAWRYHNPCGLPCRP